MLGQQLQQLTEPGRAFLDAALRHQPSLVVDQGDVMTALRPINSAPQPHSGLPPPVERASAVTDLIGANRGCASP
jgi:hypothetical protein